MIISAIVALMATSVRSDEGFSRECLESTIRASYAIAKDVKLPSEETLLSLGIARIKCEYRDKQIKVFFIDKEDVNRYTVLLQREDWKVLEKSTPSGVWIDPEYKKQEFSRFCHESARDYLGSQSEAAQIRLSHARAQRCPAVP